MANVSITLKVDARAAIWSFKRSRFALRCLLASYASAFAERCPCYMHPQTARDLLTLSRARRAAK